MFDNIMKYQSLEGKGERCLPSQKNINDSKEQW